jgi:hypothetical protein
MKDQAHKLQSIASDIHEGDDYALRHADKAEAAVKAAA